MAADSAQKIILDRYAERCRLAGGPRVGYVLRKQAILYVAEDHPGVDLEAGLAELVESGLVKASESGDFYFLTAVGAEKIGGSVASA
ncbi:MAG: hypothetical protein GY769_02270 [bacterium]|nr:hypothetical protein [bacterium]